MIKPVGTSITSRLSKVKLIEFKHKIAAVATTTTTITTILLVLAVLLVLVSVAVMEIQ